MKQHLNTLYVTLDGAFLRKDGAAIEVRHEGKSKLRVPLHNLEGIVCFGWETVASAALMAACAEANVALSFHTPHGKFLASTHGSVSGNILLRREQYRIADCEARSAAISAHILAAKIANSRILLQRTARDRPETVPLLGPAIAALNVRKEHPLRTQQLASLRGIEGDAAAIYFEVFPHLLTNSESGISFQSRTRRPPLDPVNALLSFVYTLLMHDCRSALESCGLDPQCGFLHRDRSGRPSLALDLMEEFRPQFADRLALSLFNRRQLGIKDFRQEASGAVFLQEESRKKVLVAWQERKQDIITHHFLEEKTTVGFLPHLQARLLARYIRGDLDAYPAFIFR